MMTTTVIAYGNPLRMDDGAGWAVAEALCAQPLPPDVEVVTRQQLAPELALNISCAHLVIFVDACFGGAPGTVRLYPVRPHPDPEQVFAHRMDPSVLLALTRWITGVMPPAWTIAIDAGSFEYGEQLTPPVAAAVPRAAAQIRALIASTRSSDTDSNPAMEATQEDSAARQTGS